MENMLAGVRIYLMVIVFLFSCILGLLSDVSLPILAFRSIVIVSVVGVLSHIFIKYIAGVAKTVTPAELSKTDCSANQEVDHAIDRNNK